MISARPSSLGGANGDRNGTAHRNKNRGDGERNCCDGGNPAPPEENLQRGRRDIFFSFFSLAPFAIMLLIFYNRHETERTDASKAANVSKAASVSACLCEGSNGSASRDVPQCLGVIGTKFYSCFHENSARLMKRSPLSMCFSVDNPTHFGIDRIPELKLTHLASGSILQAAHATSNSSSTVDIHPWATVHISQNYALMVVQMQQLNDAWFDPTKESSIEISGSIMIRPLTFNEGNTTLNFAMNLTEEFRFTAKTVAASYPLASTACSCYATLWNEGYPDGLGIVHRPNEHAVSYSCTARNFVSKAAPTMVCLSIRGHETLQDYRLQQLLSFNLTHPITGSVIRTIYPVNQESVNSSFDSWSSIEKSRDQTLWVFHLNKTLDPWIDAFIGTAFDIYTRVALEPLGASKTPQQSTLGHQVVQVFQLTLQAVPFDTSLDMISRYDVGGPKRESATSGSTGPAVTTESTGLKICVCDAKHDCIDDLSRLLLQNVRLCLSVRGAEISGIKSMWFQLPNGYEYSIIQMNEPQHSNTRMTEYERGKIAV